MEDVIMAGVDIYYRVHHINGSKTIARALAWAPSKLRASITKSYAEAKDGPEVVEFLTQEQYKAAGGR